MSESLLDYQISVMQQARVGEQVQYRSIGAPQPANAKYACTYIWVDTDRPLWNWSMFEYRIKPVKKEPREVYLVETKEQGILQLGYGVSMRPHPALSWHVPVKFREVIEE